MKKSKPVNSTRPPREQLAIDLDHGLGNEALAEKYGVTVNTAKNWLTKYALRRRPISKHPTDALIIAAFEQGLTNKAIATWLGAAGWYIANRIRFLGLRDKPPAPVAPAAPPPERAPSPTPSIFINVRGHSLPRIPTIHGRYEVSP